MTSRVSSSDRHALRHPIFWFALALLVVNDHALKGGGIVPGWLTGKLSDFAGLIVAPVLLSALLDARGPRRRAAAFTAVGGWFIAANVFAPVARYTSAAAAHVGLSWTFWVDPTDLVALAVLPLAWHVASHRGRLTLGAPKLWTERLALGVGVAACIASPPPEPSWTTAAFLVNRTGGRVEVRVRWVEASVDCDGISDRFAEALSRNAFEAGTTFAVEVDETLPLDRDVIRRTSAAGGAIDDPSAPGTAAVPIHSGACDVAILSAEGLPETVVFWRDLEVRVIPEVVEDDADERNVEGGLDLLAVDEEATTLELGPGRGYRTSPPVDRYDGGAACRDYGSITGFAWSNLPRWVGQRVWLTDVRETLDGCVAVTLEDGPNEHHAYVCIPPADFPFLRNNEVQIWNDENELRIVRDLRLEDGTRWRTGELVISRGQARFTEGPFDVSLVEVDAACEGVRMDCGGFRVPAAGGLELSDGIRFVHPGEIVERGADDGRRARLRVGRAETMWVTHAGCGAGRDRLGPRLEALVVYGEEPR